MMTRSATRCSPCSLRDMTHPLPCWLGASTCWAVTPRSCTDWYLSWILSLGDTLPATPAGWQPHLLDEVIKEALRLYPPIHIGNRCLAEEVDFGEGRRVPAGERLFYSIYLSHRDKSIWKNADEFCPERFEHGRKTPPFAYVPFGGGPRACIGAAFGQAEARIVIARLLQTFTFHTD